MATRRMNKMWRRTASVLVLCVLFFHSCQGQDEAITAETTETPGTGLTSPQVTVANTPAATDASQGTKASQTDVPANDNEDSQATAEAATSAPSAGTDVHFTVMESEDLMKMFGNPGSEGTVMTKTIELTVPPPKTKVMCVKKEAVKNRDAVKVELASPSSCEETMAAVTAQIEQLCDKPDCTIEIYQEDDSTDVIMTGSEIEGDAVLMANKIGGLKADLGASMVSAEKRKQSPAVFVSLLVTGLILAAGLIGGYVWKNRRSNAKGMKLAEESMMADEENQGNTLVSVAPLNPPEPQEKPSLNGESPEAVKTQNPPAATNGHSTTKTADTEL